MVWQKNCSGTILIDPVKIDLDLFEVLESSKLEVSSVLFTHISASQSALRTIPNIYPRVLFYGGSSEFSGECPVINLKETTSNIIANCDVRSIFLPGDCGDSLIYNIGNFLFTGDIVSAGSIMSTEDSLGTELIIQGIREYLFVLPDSTVIFSLHGPPSTIAIEKESNIIMKEVVH